MRLRLSLSLLIIFPLLAAPMLLAAPKPVSANEVCKNRCETDYQLCMKRSANSEGRKNCKVFRKNCTKACPGK
jgi:hypothetical protein